MTATWSGRRSAPVKSRVGGAASAAARIASRAWGWWSSVTSSRLAARMSWRTLIALECARIARMATTFPDGFVGGTDTAAHQVEGGNWNNDWWAWEHAEGTVCEEPSGDACDQYWRYPEDLDL